MPDAGRVFLVNPAHPNADDAADGTEDRPFRTISAAAALAGPGDTVRVAGGIYRERVSPARGGEPGAPVAYEAAEHGAAIIKGSDVCTGPWEAGGAADVYVARLDPAMFTDLLPTGEAGYNPFAVPAARLAGRKTLGQVFVDGVLLTEVDGEDELLRTPGTWLTNEGGTEVRVHFPRPGAGPDGHVVEIACRMRCFAPHERGLGHVTVRGFVMEHAGNQFPSGFYNPPEKNCHPQAGMLSCRSGHHWTIEHNVIRLAGAVGIDCGYEGNRDLEGGRPRVPREEIGWHTIRHNVISDNGAAGIVGAGARDSVISDNVIERNNTRGWGAPEMGGIKLHFCTNTLIEGNLIRDNDCYGVWLDNTYRGARVTRNVLINNQREGVFIELGHGPCLVDNNVVAYTRAGAGIYCHDAAGVHICHNLCFANSHFGIYARTVTERQFKRAGRGRGGARHLRVLNNLLIDNYRGHVCLPPDSDVSGDNLCDYNLLVNGVHPHWEGLGAHKFAVNDNDGMTDRSLIVEALRRALDEAGVPPERRPNLDAWNDMPYVNLEQWRLVTGFDTHSVAPVVAREQRVDGAVAEGAVAFSARTPYVEFRDGRLVTRMTCPPVDLPEHPGGEAPPRWGRRIEKDFLGRPLPQGGVSPGPFQHLADGHNFLVLFPVVEAG
jgi:parallel beta-helix repeat protein